MSEGRLEMARTTRRLSGPLASCWENKAARKSVGFYLWVCILRIRGGVDRGMKNPVRFLLPSVCFVFLLTPLVGQEAVWNQFRGPGAAGHSDLDGIPVSFKDEDLAWKVKLPGTGSSSPVFWGEHVYLTATERDGKRYVLCLDAESGKEKWRRDFAFSAYRQHKFNSFASSTPCTDADGVYVTWTNDGERHVIALGHDGERRWAKTLGGFSANHGSGDSPAVVDGTVLVLNLCEEGDSQVAGLSTKDGAVKWSVERGIGKASYHTPTLFRPDGAKGTKGEVQAVFASQANGMFAVEPGSGKVLWEANPEFDQRVVGCPVAVNGQLFVTAGSGGAGKDSALVTPGSEENEWEAKVTKRLKKALPYVPTPIVSEGHLFLWGDRGIVTCIGLDEWDTPYMERVGGNYYASPVRIGEVIYNVSREGRVVAIPAKPPFKVLGESDLGEPCDSTLAVHGGRLYIRSYAHLRCLEPAKK